MTVTRSPASANRRAVGRPMPVPPPETITCRKLIDFYRV
jgi:hypothetical protein